MREVPLRVEPRQDRGKGAARRGRAEGNIPAVLYGPKTPPQSLRIDVKDFRQATRAAEGTTAIYSFEVNGEKYMTLIRELQRDPVTSDVLHVDFHAISLDKPLQLSIPIHLTGTPPGVKQEGGIMQTTLRELEISCLPKDIPERFEVDVSHLNIGDAIHVEDIQIPNVEILTEKGRTIVVISPPTIVKVAEPTEEEVELAEGEEAEAAEEGAEAAEGEEKAEGEEGEQKKEE